MVYNRQHERLRNGIDKSLSVFMNLEFLWPP